MPAERRAGHPEALNEKQLAWAYRKWCEGHGLRQIATALFIHPDSLSRTFKRKNLERKLIPLVYEEE